MKKGIFAIAVAMVMLVFAASAGATTIYVATTGDNDTGDGSESNPYATIQKGIDVAADSGDTVQVAAGTYQENVVWDSKSLALVGAGAEDTLIDGSVVERCLSVSNVGRSFLEGFTFQNGAAPEGGGLYIEYSALTVTGVTVKNNFAASGGGVYTFWSDCVLRRCLIKNNIVSHDGGGLFDSMGSWSEVTASCLIVGNEAGGEGGGIYYSYSSARLTNCTITGNTGGGVACLYAPPYLPAIANCIIWDNSGGSDLVGATATYSDVGTGVTDGVGNISEDPMFVTGDIFYYHLQEVSPCINRGNNFAPGRPPRDIDGDARIKYGVVDMGADEVPLPYPDLWIQQWGSWLGDDVYNNDGAGQTAGRISRGAGTTFYVRLYNDGDKRESFRVTGTSGDDNWTVQYFRLMANQRTEELTDSVTGDGWLISIKPGRCVYLRIVVTRASGVTSGSIETLLHAESVRLPSCRDCVKAITSFVSLQPDLWIKQLGVWLGDDIYNNNGMGQTGQRAVKPGTSASYQVLLYNDGPELERFWIKGPAGDDNWTVQYLQGKTDVTAEVTSVKGWLQAGVAPSGRRQFRIVVMPRSGLTAGSSLELLVRVASERDPAQRDTIKAVTRVK